MACILNRVGTLGPAPGKRSRGELVLEALDHADAAAAADALSALDARAYRPFNLVIADNRDAYWLRHDGEGAIVKATPLPPGLSMITAHDRNASASPRQTRWRPAFEAAPRPDPEHDDWAGWKALLAAPADEGAEPSSGMTVRGMGDFTTVSSALIALPSMDRPETRPVFQFADGPPAIAPFLDVEA